MFTNAIVRKPGKSLISGLTTAGLGLPDYEIALVQHADYINALQECGLEVLVLDEDEAYPDSTFVEDTAVLTRDCAIITNPGAASRKGEVAAIKPVLEEFFSNVEEIQAPGTVDGGDVMMVGSHFYIGHSERTNREGARQLIACLEKYGMTGSLVKLDESLHLKTGLAYLEQNRLVASGEYTGREEFREFEILAVDNDESYAANCLWVNGTVLVPKGYEKIKAGIEGAGYAVKELDVSEFKKLDGGLSCLSLRY